MTTAESDFYARHYGGGLMRAGTMPLDQFEREMLAPGKRYSLLAEHLAREQPSGASIAEIGCATADALLILSQRYSFRRIIGVDIATASEGINADGLEIFTANLNEAWPFGDGEIDYLVAMMIIEHLFDPFHAFREIKRCLSAKGCAFVNLPLVTSVRNRARLLLGRLPVTSSPYENWFEKGEWDGNHLHYFSLSSIRDIARACSLRVGEIRGVGALHRWKTRMPSLLAGEVTFQLQRGA
jgi:SAM-dependent methyltransferase